MVLFKAVRNCLYRHLDGEKGALNFERVQLGVHDSKYRLPPRIYAPRSIGTIAGKINKQSFVLRCKSQWSQKFAMHAIRHMGDGSHLKRWTRRRGCFSPALGFYFDIGDSMRALMKVGLNLVAAYCKNTPVNRQEFSKAIGVILDGDKIVSNYFPSNGFVRPADVDHLKDKDGGHAFRLVHADGVWNVYSSFFGGMVGTFVQIPGPNRENWVWADIISPIGSKNWSFNPHSIYPLERRCEVIWNNSEAIIPSFPIHNRESGVRIIPVRSRKHRR